MQLKKRAIPYTLFNLIAVIALVVEKENENFVSFCSMLILAYVLCRNMYTKHIDINMRTQVTSLSLAPASIWLDHFTYYFMLFVVVLIANKNLSLFNFNAIVMDFVEIFALLMAFVPVWSLHRYLNRRKVGA